MKIRKILIFILFVASFQVIADGHCYDFPNDADCKKEKKVDLLDFFKGGNDSDGDKYPDGLLEERNYSIFSDEGDHFKELVKQGKFLSASKLFNKYEQSFFNTNATFGGESRIEKYNAEIKEVSQYFINSYKDEYISLFKDIDNSIQLINSTNESLFDKWTFFKGLIQRSNKLRDKYGEHHVIRYHQKTIKKSGIVDRWEVATNNVVQNILDKRNSLEKILKDNASKEFDRFDFSSGNDFFKEYPVVVFKSEVIRESSDVIIKWIKDSTIDEAIALIDKYDLKKSKTVKNKLAVILLDKASRKTYGKEQPRFMDVIATLKQIQDLGIYIEPSALPTRYKTFFYVINSTNDFNSFKDVLSKDEPYLVVIDKRKLNIQKSEGILNKVYSKYVSRRENISNPDYISEKRRYDNAHIAYNSAVQNYQNALAIQEESRRQYQREQYQRQLNAGYDTNCYGYGNNINCSTSPGVVMFVPDYSDTIGAIGPSIAQGKVSKARAALSNAERRLSSIPREVEKLVYSDYSFTTRTYEVIKNYDYNIYVINKVNGKYFLTNIPQESKQTFVVASDLNSQDANHKPTDFQTLDDLEIFISGQEDHSIGDLMSKIPSEYSLVEYSDIKGLINNIKASYKEPVSEAVDDASVTSKLEPISSDYIKDLQRIKALLDSGVIDQDDFETLKQKIIDKL